MTTVHVLASMAEEERRQRLYAGDLVVAPATTSSLALTDFARELIEAAFAPHEPIEAQYHLPVEEWVERFAPVKPQFIHHPRTAELIPSILVEAGCDPETTFWDVPRLRGVTSDGYLTAGVGYAHHPHRDTWYSAPMAQLNWWTPIYAFASESSMAFHPRYFDVAVENDSTQFNYYDWNANARKNAAQHVRSDTRWQPKAQVPLELDPEIRVVGDVGSLLVFSAAQLHSTVPNTSGIARFSIDFRTVDLADLEAGRSAPNVDSRPTGTSLRDFRRCSDGAPVPDEIISQYDAGSHAGGELVFRPS